VDQRTIRLHLPSALQCADPRRLWNVFGITATYNKHCKAKFSEFKRAYLDLAVDH
jgi:hypothetical protein